MSLESETDREYLEYVMTKPQDFLPKQLLREYIEALKDLEYAPFIEKQSVLGFTAEK